MFVLIRGRTGGQKPGFFRKFFVVVHRLAKKPGFFGLMGKSLLAIEFYSRMADQYDAVNAFM